jgi:hypothetical protein
MRMPDLSVNPRKTEACDFGRGKEGREERRGFLDLGD